jgi:hypothetical protein
MRDRRLFTRNGGRSSSAIRQAVVDAIAGRRVVSQLSGKRQLDDSFDAYDRLT